MDRRIKQKIDKIVLFDIIFILLLQILLLILAMLLVGGLNADF